MKPRCSPAIAPGSHPPAIDPRTERRPAGMHFRNGPSASFRMLILVAWWSVLGLCPAGAAFAAGIQESVGPLSSNTIPEGAVVGQVFVRIENIFDASDPRENRGLYRLANTLHRRTREDAIRSQLLFNTGDPYSARELAETERTLRANGYLAEAVVRPAATRGNQVDVEVVVRDVWTMVPDVSFGRQGGANHSSVSLQDDNFFGTGKSIQLERSTDVDRTETGLTFVDPNVLGSRWRLGLGYFDNSDGHSREFAVGRPFYELDSLWSASFLYGDDDREVPLYALGHQVDSFRSQQQRLRLEGGFSKGVIEGWTSRWLIGLTSDETRFSAGRDQGAAIASLGATGLPADRHYLYPWLGWEIIEDQYSKTTNLNQIGRIEDLYLGTSARFELGFSPARDGTPSTALFAAHAHTAREWADGQRIGQLNADASGRFAAGGLRNVRLDLGAEYFQRFGDKQVSLVRLSTSLARDPDPDAQLLLGGDNGLRGYPLRYQAGKRSALLTLEHRYFTDWYPFRIARIGAAVFFDAGRTWGDDVTGAPTLGWLKDVGVGLRLGNARSSHGSVIHVDVAMPLDRTDDISSMQFLISTHKSF